MCVLFVGHTYRVAVQDATCHFSVCLIDGTVISRSQNDITCSRLVEDPGNLCYQMVHKNAKIPNIKWEKSVQFMPNFWCSVPVFYGVNILQIMVYVQFNSIFLSSFCLLYSLTLSKLSNLPIRLCSLCSSSSILHCKTKTVDFYF